MSQAFGITKGAEPSSFTDVVSGSWYYDDVTLLASNGILKGYEDGRFGPGDPISREQMAAIIDRFIDAKGLNIAETREFDLTDLNAAAEYARPSITQLYQAEVISGMGDGLYAPKATATRAQSCVIIYNALGKAGLL
jgi:endo-1,4-beta-xylanase